MATTQINTAEPIRRLYCACCGAVTRGRQWHNRDTGYGFCLDCAQRLRTKGYDEDEITRLYGHDGVHWNVAEVA